MYCLASNRTIQIPAAASAFLVGLLLGHWHWQVSLVAIVIGLFTLALSYRKQLFLPTLMVVGLALVIARGQQSQTAYAGLDKLIGSKVSLTGVVADDPSVSDKNYTNFTLGNMQYEGMPIAGQIRVRGRYMKLKRGYSISAKGKLQPTVGNKQAEFGFADVVVLGDKQSALEQWRQRFFAGMRSALPEPLASFALGLLLGTRALIPKALNDQLALVGLSHLVAVSGYNLTILVESVRRPMQSKSKYLSLAIPLWLILGFTVLTGFSASIVRAAIVSSLILIAYHYGRTIKPMVLIGVAAIATTLWRPDYLWSDLGWQLSFAAFFGILVVAPAFERRFVKRPNVLKSLLIASVAAQLMTAPLIALIFGQLSVVAPLSNLLVLPLVPAIMFASLLAGMAGMFLPALSGWMAWPASWLLKLVIVIVETLAGQRGASSNFRPTTGSVIIFYSLLLVLLLVIIRAIKRTSPKVADPNLESIIIST